jgi:hypothetical protein
MKILAQDRDMIPGIVAMELAGNHPDSSDAP